MPFTAAILATILAYIWLLASRLSSDLLVVPASVVLTLGVVHAIRRGDWGLAPRALLPGLRAATVFTVPFVAAFLIAGGLLGTLHDRTDFLGNLGWLILWGGAQQWVLQTVVLREAQRAARRPRGAAVLLAAALFASVHLPNPFLAAATFVGALGWCAIYEKAPNVVPLALSHAVATLAILYAFDDRITGRLRIGAAYLDLMR